MIPKKEIGEWRAMKHGMKHRISVADDEPLLLNQRAPGTLL
jgi:hypothetical protein